MFRLGQLYAHFAELGRLDQLALLMRVVAGEAPATSGSLADLRVELRAAAELQRRGRGPTTGRHRGIARTPRHVAA